MKNLATLRNNLAIAALALALSCCAPKGPTTAAAPPAAAAPADPMEASRESISQGNYQLAACATSISELINSVKDLQKSTKSPDVKAAMTSILDQLDDAGSSIADYTEEPPALDKFKTQFAVFDEKRLQAIDGANDALHDLYDVGDSLDDASGNAPAEDADELDDIGNSLDDATKGLKEALQSYGGKAEEDSEDSPRPSEGEGSTGG